MTTEANAVTTLEAPRRRLSINTAIFAFSTALSRIVGLVREIVAANYFGTGGRLGVHDRVADPEPYVEPVRAIGAFGGLVPVFTDLLERGRKREAFQLASTLFWMTSSRSAR